MRRSYWLAVLAYLEVIIPLGLASMIIQALFFAWVYPKLFASDRTPWARGALTFGFSFGIVAWSFAVLPVAAKYRMSSVQDFLVLETTFTVLQFAIVSPLIALAHRVGASKSRAAALA